MSIKLKGSLKQKVQTADIISQIVLDFKDKFKNLSIESLKNDYNTILCLMHTIEKKFKDKKLYDVSNQEPDKNDILIQILKSLFPQITDSELMEIEKVINLIITNNLVGKSKGFFLNCISIVKKVLPK